MEIERYSVFILVLKRISDIWKLLGITQITHSQISSRNSCIKFCIRLFDIFDQSLVFVNISTNYTKFIELPQHSKLLKHDLRILKRIKIPIDEGRQNIYQTKPRVITIQRWEMQELYPRCNDRFFWDLESFVNFFMPIGWHDNEILIERLYWWRKEIIILLSFVFYKVIFYPVKIYFTLLNYWFGLTFWT